MQKAFLQAEWRRLAMANYAVDKSLLTKYLPYKTEIDSWNNTCYISLVGFMFLNTRIKGFKIPFHINFEEVNLRFYVRHHDGRESKRGVVFIKEIVPKPALTFIANSIYKENYETMAMGHSWDTKDDSLAVEYRWKKKSWHSLKVIADKDPSAIADGSEEEFITEHYWGYTQINDKSSSEYQVEHPRWQVYKVREFFINVDFSSVYGYDFAFLAYEKPISVFLAEGSEIIVRGARKI
jgi:uncharacterized protein YqjF (DUF2071 family)